MTTSFGKKVYRETEHATIRSKSEKKIIVGLEPGDLISLRLKKERKPIYIAASTVFRIALSLEVARIKREKVAAKKLKGKS